MVRSRVPAGADFDTARDVGDILAGDVAEDDGYRRHDRLIGGPDIGGFSRWERSRRFRLPNHSCGMVVGMAGAAQTEEGGLALKDVVVVGDHR